MADETEEEAEAAAKAKKKKMMIGVLIIAGLAYQFVLKGSPPPEDEAAVEEVVEIIEGDIASMEEMVVNLADTDQVRYLRLGVAAVLNAEFALEVVEPQLAKVSDVVIDVVSTKTFDELRETGATTALKEEISIALQDVFEEGEVVRVVFTT